MGTKAIFCDRRTTIGITNGDEVMVAELTLENPAKRDDSFTTLGYILDGDTAQSMCDFLNVQGFVQTLPQEDHETIATHLKHMLQSAVELEQSKAGWQESFAMYLNMLPPLPDEKFWPMTDKLADMVRRSNNQIEQAINEFYRLAEDDPSWTFTEALRFTKTWKELCCQLSVALDKIVTDKSDDSYGDLIDSMPFTGKVFCQKCLRKKIPKGEFKGHLEVASRDGWWFRWVYQGEHYMQMHLKDIGMKRFVHVIQEE